MRRCNAIARPLSFIIFEAVTGLKPVSCTLQRCQEGARGPSWNQKKPQLMLVRQRTVQALQSW